MNGVLLFIKDLAHASLLALGIAFLIIILMGL